MYRTRILKNLKLFLIVSPILYILWLISPIEFIESGFGSIFFCIVTFIYLICLLILLNLIVFQKNEKPKTKDFITRIIFNAFYGCCLLIFILFTLFAASMGGYYEKTIFVSKNNPDEKIILRGSNGGAWDSDFPVYRVIKLTPIIRYFKIVKDIDTNQINMMEWIRVEK